MRILGLDTGTKTGWCLMENGKIVESGVQKFETKRGESSGIRFLRFRKWMEEMMSYKPAVVVFEQAHHRGGAATNFLVGLTTRIEEVVAGSLGIECLPVHSNTLKKFITGHGKADKSKMMEVISREYGIELIDDNHADAIALCKYAETEV